MQSVVDSAIPVTRTTVSSSQLLAMDDVQLLPGETYPSQSIHLIQIQDSGFVSKYVFFFASQPLFLQIYNQQNNLQRKTIVQFPLLPQSTRMVEIPPPSQPVYS